MSLVLRLLLYALCLFLVMIVYVGQRHSTARGTLRESVRMTAKFLVWSVVGIVVILGLEYVFVD